MEGHLALFGCVALLMVVTYTSVGILYPDDGTDYLGSYQSSYEMYNMTAFTYAQWMDTQWILSYEVIVKGGTGNYEAPIFNFLVHDFIKRDYGISKMLYQRGASEYKDIFEEFGVEAGSGYIWTLSDYPQGQDWEEIAMGCTRDWRIHNEYMCYKNTVDGNDQSNMLDAVFEFFGTILDSFAQMIRVMTFTNIPHMPPAVTIILNCLFIPLWIVMAIAIAPYAVDFIKAIASLIDAIVPF